VNLLVLLLVLALVAFVLGFVTAAKWLFIVAIVLVVAGLLSSMLGRRSRI
jgi:hypothetical protein